MNRCQMLISRCITLKKSTIAEYLMYYFCFHLSFKNPSRCQISRDVHWDTRISFWHVGQVVCPHGVPDTFRPSHHPQRLGLLQGALGSRTVKILPFTIAHSMSLTFINQDHSTEVPFVIWGFNRFFLFYNSHFFYFYELQTSRLIEILKHCIFLIHLMLS